MRIKIISDGVSMNTKVVDADTGEVLERVKAVSWGIGVGEISKCIVEFIYTPAELEVAIAELRLTGRDIVENDIIKHLLAKRGVKE